MRHFLGSSLKL